MISKLRVSDYNFIFPDFGADGDSSALVYNSRSGAMAVLDEKSFSVFNALKDGGQPIQDKELEEGFIHCGFLIEDQINEKNELRLQMYRSRFASSQLALVIAPSMNCNFQCPYCFEKGNLHSRHMTDEVADKITEFVTEQASQLSHLEITWFGGEPLLDIPRIESLSNEFTRLCRKNNIEYKSDIVTNGYIYTPDTARLLKGCSISSVQITIDGAKETHDKRRFLQTGTGTFDTIIKNLKATKGILPVALRINIDSTNMEETGEVLSLLKSEELEVFVKPYLGHVERYNDSCTGSCLTKKQFSEYSFRFIQDIGRSIEKNFPEPKGNCCFADSSNAWVIDPFGDMYKCYLDIGDKTKKIYSLIEENDKPTKLLNDYMLFDPTTHPRCGTCKLLPLCMGGCPAMLLSEKDSCAKFKHTLNEYITSCARAVMA